ncbi:DUF7503 family protein [Salinilacihabitans rarus]|nr:hypothetical protein [Salinilacihabitans rarus]
MSHEDSNSTVATYLKENPRMIGALFTLALLLAQATPVMAKNSSTLGGP